MDAGVSAPRLHAWLTTPTELRVPRVTAAFWIIKALSTAMGESTSDYLVHVIAPVAAVLFGFVAMGTALGDLTAYSLNLGYFASALIFAALIVVLTVGYRWLRWNGVLAFWFAYVLTRPLGASLADGLGKPSAVNGLGLGSGRVALGLALLIAAGVAYLSVSTMDVQAAPVGDDHGSSAHRL